MDEDYQEYKMWTSGDELDIEKASDYANKLILLGSAQKAGIFESIAQERDIASLKRLLQADERALYIVLEALCAMGYARKRRGRYVITDRARPLFLERGEDYVGDFLPHFLNRMRAQLAIPDIIKGARPERTTLDVAAFMNAMASRPDRVVEEAVNQCLKRKRGARNVLDLGGGPGKYSRAFINRGMNVVLYDKPEVIDYVSTAFGLKEIKGLSLKKGDFTASAFEAEFAKESFDIVFMGNICHIYSEDENKLLIKRARDLLKENGIIAIEDFVRGRSPMAEMFAVNMLANTEGGNTWNEAQYRGWLKGVGFHKIKVIDLHEKERQIITAFR